MHIALRKNPYQGSWWEQEVINLTVRIDRSDVVIVALSLIAIGLFLFGHPGWDFVLGRH